MPSEVAVALSGISVTYDRWGQTVTALDDISLSIGQGEWALIAGPNGCGKSTLLGVIAGLISPSKGRVELTPSTAGSVNTALRTRPFLVHQDPLLGTAAGLTVEENLRVTVPSAPQTRRDRLHQYRQWLEPIGLETRLRQPVESLSGGERQLLALLIAQVRSASLILLDEPLSAMDPSRALIAQRQIVALHDSGATVIQVTHDADQVAEFSGRVVGLRRGRVVYDSSSDQNTTKRSVSWLWSASSRDSELPR